MYVPLLFPHSSPDRVSTNVVVAHLRVHLISAFLPANIKYQHIQSYLTQELLGLMAVQEGDDQ